MQSLEHVCDVSQQETRGESALPLSEMKHPADEDHGTDMPDHDVTTTHRALPFCLVNCDPGVSFCGSFRDSCFQLADFTWNKKSRACLIFIHSTNLMWIAVEKACITFVILFCLFCLFCRFCRFCPFCLSVRPSVRPSV